MIALSFLGAGNYEEVNYSYSDKKVSTSFFPYAVSQFVNPEKLFVIMTEKAEKTHAESLSNLCDFEPIKIPDGKTENEFWVIFDKITSVIKPNDEVVFDITHGFRSQPFIVIVLLLYLKALKNIRINNILYGAYEARDENNTAPVFELKTFMDLVEWSNAAREFIHNGNMGYFKLLLSEIQRNSYLNKLAKPAKQLRGAGDDLSKLTDAFATIRLEEIFQNVFSFNKRLFQVKEDLENNPQAKPFGTIINLISNQFKTISEAEKDIFSEKGFEAQKTILNWYIETSKFQKAITLAREYIISKYLVEMLRSNKYCLLEKGCRKEAEHELGQQMKLRQSGFNNKTRKGEYGELWGKITDMRNDINHAGMRKNPIPSSKLIERIKEIIITINDNF